MGNKNKIKKTEGSISVVIITRNRYEMLKECILSLLRQTISADEIIVVDDSSDDPTLQIPREYLVKYVRTSRRLGVAGARNLGTKVAVGEWIAFIDDDAIADIRWLESLRKSLSEGIAAVRGRVISKSSKINILAGHYDLGNKVCETSSLLGCNMIINRSALEKAGLFDERLVAYHDEYDLSLRLFKLGKILYCPYATVKHDYAQSLKGFICKKFNSGLWRVYVNVKSGRPAVEARRIPFVTLLPVCVVLSALSILSQLIFNLLIMYASLLLIARYASIHLKIRNVYFAIIGGVGELTRDLGVLIGLFKFSKGVRS